MKRNAAIFALIAVLLPACSSGSGGQADSTRGDGTASQFVDIHGLGVDVTGILYVATHRGLVRRDSDGSWTYTGSDRSDHMGFTLDPMTRTMFRSGHPAGGGSLGVETSSDGGSWTHLSDVLNPPADFHAMTVSFADGITVYGRDSGDRGTFRSVDGGRTWVKIPSPAAGQPIYTLAGSPRRGEVLAGGARGLYRSVNRGATWAIVTGPSVGYVAAIGVDPKSAAHMLISTQHGVKGTIDGGKSWTDAGVGLPTDQPITSLTISPADAAVAYAAFGTTVFATKDSGKTWKSIRTES